MGEEEGSEPSSRSYHGFAAAKSLTRIEAKTLLAFKRWSS